MKKILIIITSALLCFTFSILGSKKGLNADNIYESRVSISQTFMNITYGTSANFPYVHITSFYFDGERYYEISGTSSYNTYDEEENVNVYNYSILYATSARSKVKQVASLTLEPYGMNNQYSQDISYTVGSSNGNSFLTSLEVRGGVKYGFEFFGIGAEGSTSLGHQFEKESVETVCEETSFEFSVTNTTNKYVTYGIFEETNERSYISIDYQTNFNYTSFLFIRTGSSLSYSLPEEALIAKRFFSPRITISKY